MKSNTVNVIDNIINSNKIYAYQKEFQTASEQRREWLQIMLSSLGVENVKPKKSKIEEIHDMFEKQALKVKWTKLTTDQKIGRIKEYVDRVHDGDKEVYDDYIDLLENKKLKAKNIIYDTNAGIIVNIDDD